MMAYYRIEVMLQNETGPTTENLDVDERDEAMRIWDEVVDNILPGDSARLIDMDGGRILSEYHPVDRSK